MGAQDPKSKARAGAKARPSKAPASETPATAASETPAAATEASVAAPKDPVAAPKDPVAAPKDPVAAPKAKPAKKAKAAATPPAAAVAASPAPVAAAASPAPNAAAVPAKPAKAARAAKATAPAATVAASPAPVAAAAPAVAAAPAKPAKKAKATAPAAAMAASPAPVAEAAPAEPEPAKAAKAGKVAPRAAKTAKAGKLKPEASEVAETTADSVAEVEVDAADAPLAPMPTVPEALRTPEPEPELQLPVARGRDFLVAMPRDPESAFLYWELTADGIDRARAALGQPGARLVLRVYLMPESAAADSAEAEVRDLPVDGWIGRYALELQRPGLRVVAAIGLLGEGDAGAFAHIVRAAAVSLPRRWPSGGAVRFSRVPDQTEADASLAALHPSRRPAPRPEGALPAPVWVGEAVEAPADNRRADHLPAGFGAPLPEYLALGGGRGNRPANSGAPANVPAGSNHLDGGGQRLPGSESGR